MKSRLFFIAGLIIIASVITFLITNKKGDAWEESVRKGLYALSSDSIPDYDVDIIDSLGIPYTWYPTQNGITPGTQYNATIVCNYALKYHDTLRQINNPQTLSHFLHCVAWLQQAMERHAGYALFRFHWQQPWYDSVKSAFTSGMTSGLAMQVFTRAFSITKDSSLLADASLLLKGFSIPIDLGGFTYKEPNGWWYEELADTLEHTPRILDGHLFALFGLYEYYRYNGDPLALDYFKQGLGSLKHALPLYDAGKGEICYDKYCSRADIKYRRIITGQMEQLVKISPDPVFKYFLQKWSKPLTQPYAFRVVRDGNRSGIILLSLLWIVCIAGFGTAALLVKRFYFKQVTNNIIV